MNSLDEILLLGDPRLHIVCDEVQQSEVISLQPVIDKLADLVYQFRDRYGKGRAIAAPQIGVMKRLVVINIEEPIALFNPIVKPRGAVTFDLWDDCMSFPNLLVKVSRYRSIQLTFHDIKWSQQEWKLEGDMSELMQHECDHLDGILATQRAIDKQSLRLVRPSWS